ncbi:hypothetical protein C8J57DRAFT_1398770 [Mycena rebaudengoi]|nr:hypothetical protein C8J57DRAFT_1398770 [Mycena rebaudengoi]
MGVPSESPWIAVSDDGAIAGVPVPDVASAGMRHQAAILLFWSVMPAQTTLHLLLDLILLSSGVTAGCYLSLRNRAMAQELFDALPELMERKKVGGKDRRC